MAKSFDELVQRTTTKKTQAKGLERAQELLCKLVLKEVRHLVGKSQQELAQMLGIKQPSLSKFEQQADMQISTLRRIVNALGGELEVLARFPKATVKIDQFDATQRRRRRSRDSSTPTPPVSRANAAGKRGPRRSAAPGR